MFETMHRPYKERSAQQTITLLRTLLAQIGLLPEESFYGNPYPELFSVSLSLPEEKGGFRANGKGRTSEFSLASAYAEFVERMQNGLFAIFPRTIVSEFKQNYGFYYMPDECYLTHDEFSSLPEEITNDIVRYNGAGRREFMMSYHARVKTNGAPGVVAVPFFDTKNRKVISLPLNLLLLTIGSNGMAAGNTRAEAIYQGLSEILERWGAAEVFFGQLTPPTIPIEYLAQYEQEVEIIKAIEACGRYRVTIKDFSAGQGIPSLGLIVEYPEKNTYRLNVGCDTCFQVALSRCLTEIYQGIANESMFAETALLKPKEEASYFTQNDENSMYARYIEFAQFTKDNRGQYPLSLFAEAPSYEFDPKVWTQGDSHVEEVRRLITFFHSKGRNVYLRDVSFMGFPSVFCYVPEVSAMGRKNVPPPVINDTPIMLDLDKIEPKALKLKSCSDEELKKIAEVLEKLGGQASFVDVFGISLKQESPWTQYNIAFMLSQTWYKLGHFDWARDNFKKFLKTREDDKNTYYELVDRYLGWRAEGFSAEEAGSKLADDTKQEELARIVAEDLADPALIFQYTRLPNCPDCSACELQQDCVTTGKLTMMGNVQKALTTQLIDQAELAWTI
jgi:YcaO-like protein with predicted kinase domain